MLNKQELIINFDTFSSGSKVSKKTNLVGFVFPVDLNSSYFIRSIYTINLLVTVHNKM